MCVRVPGDQGPSGTIEFINCLSENTGQAGANVYGQSVGNLKVRFVNCNWINSQGTAVVLNMQKPSTTGTGSIEFVNCSVYEERPGPTVQVMTLEGGDYGDDVVGAITVHNKHGARITRRSVLKVLYFPFWYQRSAWRTESFDASVLRGFPENLLYTI